jgi:hypothetical protein
MMDAVQGIHPIIQGSKQRLTDHMFRMFNSIKCSTIPLKPKFLQYMKEKIKIINKGR